MSGFFGQVPLRAAFDDVLETVRRDAPEAEAPADPDIGGQDAAAHVSFEFLQALDGVSAAQPAGPRFAPGASPYGDAEALPDEGDRGDGPPRPDTEPTAEPAPPATAQASDPAALAHELHLRPGLTRAELARMRRAFALVNHPDRLAPAARDAATRRMTMANALIDMAMKEAPKGR